MNFFGMNLAGIRMNSGNGNDVPW
jgi:hypothetical protein